MLRGSLERWNRGERSARGSDKGIKEGREIFHREVVVLKFHGDWRPTPS